MFIFTQISLLLVLQLQDTTTDRDLYNRIVGQARPAEQLRLVLEFERKFPNSTLAHDVYALAMDLYATRKDAARMLAYGEKAIKAKPENLHALVAVSHELAVAGRNLDRAVRYAERAIKVADRVKNEPPANYRRQQWIDYVSQNRASAEATLKYIRDVRAKFERQRP